MEVTKMNKKDINKVTKISESLDWSVIIDGNEFEFEKWSPAGQDFIMSITANNIDELIDELYEKYDNYDPSEEAYLWLDDSGHGKNGAPYDMKDVYEDMEACQEMILELHDAIMAKNRWNKSK
jgi:hypothetical protein